MLVSDLIKNIDKQVNRAESLLRDGDRAPYFLRGEGFFTGGQTTPVEIALSVPADGDFYGTSLMFAIDFREQPSRANNVAAAALPYLPTDWTFTNDIVLNRNLAATDIGSVSGLFEILTPQPYANSPTNVALTYSARHGYEAAPAILSGDRPKVPFCAYAGALKFYEPLFVVRGTAITVRFTATYAAADVEDPETVTPTPEYRITAIIPGYKKVKSFK